MLREQRDVPPLSTRYARATAQRHHNDGYFRDAPLTSAPLRGDLMRARVTHDDVCSRLLRSFARLLILR